MDISFDLQLASSLDNLEIVDGPQEPVSLDAILVEAAKGVDSTKGTNPFSLERTMIAPVNLGVRGRHARN